MLTKGGVWLQQSAQPPPDNAPSNMDKSISPSFGRMPTAFLTVETKPDGTFSHYFTSDETGELLVSSRCFAAGCNCMGCKLVEMHVCIAGEPVPLLEHNDWRRVDEVRVMHAIYHDVTNVVAFLKRDPSLTQEFLPAIMESPMELMFHNLAQHELSLHPQFEVGPYRLDFAIPEWEIAIEIDGHEFHKTKEQRQRDAARDRYLSERGWTVLRFTGSEVYQDTQRCVAQVCRIVDSRIAKKTGAAGQ